MTYNLLTVDAVRPTAMAAALAACLGTAANDVEMVDPDGDPGLPNWDAPVLCTYQATFGDVAWSLDIYIQDYITVRPTESEVAAGLAQATATTVLFPAVEAPPSAYWAVTPGGLLTRARLEPSDDEPPLLEVTAVEEAVPQLPRAIVTRFAEIVREQRLASPVAEAFKVSVEQLRRTDSNGARPSLDDGIGSILWAVQDNLVIWERVIRQMESGWAPSGWYPADLYRERLEARDELARIGARLPGEVAELLDGALEDLDCRFVAATDGDASGSLYRELMGVSVEPGMAGWWWQRCPNPRPWARM
ncbi:MULTISPECIES: hypothetical protein [unclassified Streptomyces]|uniref:hypothetical protein n=1 Tax=unclassified Streptomyces TaxID=2593676 RepID=UPI000DC76C74|nr:MULTISPECIES: hypothetical protein [unclassified Streptomyces]AWZ04604.1 hypothetical protein DRB89_08070 [Streptomyces sp. ICC4]AWZ11416.1 hypothetical protein DRB96_02765 [Streptomyces sp. ICC1]